MSYDSTADTLLHIKRVNELLIMFATDLLQRAVFHDNSKLVDPEKSEFDRLTPLLKDLTYGSEEYTNSLKELQGALDHHYYVNSHHPQHYQYGVNDMNLLDVVEMFMDWKAATERTKDGDIRRSIELNVGRFHISQQLESIFKNTVDKYGW